MKLIVVLFLLWTALALSSHTTSTSNNTATDESSKLTEDKLCAFNSIGMVPAIKNHTYSVLEKKSGDSYKSSDFSIKWKDIRAKNHEFFKWIGQNSNFKRAYADMLCHLANKQTFQRVCNINPKKVDNYYKDAFGQDIIFTCTVPKNHFVLDLRFVLKLDNLTAKPIGKWSVFYGLHKYNNTTQAKKIIQTQGLKIRNKLEETKLNTFDINSHLNIIPLFISESLASAFSKNFNSTYVKDIETKTEYDLTDQGYLRILPPGTQFILGNIYNGTARIKQICDNYSFDQNKDSCGLNLITAKSTESQ